MPSNPAIESPITSAESPNDAAESSNDSESESFCSSEKNDLIVVWGGVFRSWIAVIDLFLEFGIELQ